jgi:hypothetical protein
MKRRHALVIGIGDYPGKNLPNAVADARKACKALRTRGFDTFFLEDATAEEIDTALEGFKAAAAGADIALIFLVGHAVERHGAGYFLPSDFPFPAAAGRVLQRSVPIDQLVGAVRAARTGIIVLDACRNWPSDLDDQINLSNDMDRQIAAEQTWNNVLLAYSTSSTTQATDGKEGEGSPFTDAFCRNVLRHDLTIDECFRRITQEVTLAHRTLQQPWTYSSLATTPSFTDLPKFRVLTRHVLPNFEQASGAWSAPNQEGDGILSGLGNSQAYSVNLAGWERLLLPSSISFTGAAAFTDAVLLATDDGDIYQTGPTDGPFLSLPTDAVFGVTRSPQATSFVRFGKTRADLFSVQDKAVSHRIRLETSFDVYCAAYLDEDNVLLGGEKGHVLQVSLGKDSWTERAFLELPSHVNSIAASLPNGPVYFSGQSGLLVESDVRGNQVRQLLEPRLPKTPAGIRAALVNYARNSQIRSYIFDRSSLDAQTVEQMETLLRATSYPTIAHAPNLPILAVGTDESTVILLDTRDRQIVQELDLSTPFPGEVTGLTFISDTEFLALTTQGHVVFLSS